MKQTIKERIEQINRGEVPSGYKKTTIGIVPFEWEDKKIRNVGSFSKGKGLPGTEMKNEGLPCIGYGDIYTKYNLKFDRAHNFVEQNIADESVPAEKGTLMFTCSGETAIEIGKCVCYIGDETIYVGGDIAIFKPNSKVEPLFIAYQQSIFSSIKQKARYSQGHSVAHIYSDSLGKLGVAYPKDIVEQQKIAKILSIWDEVISLQEKLIEKLEIQKKALMQQVLVPNNEWKKVTIRDLFDVTRGQVLAVSECDELYKYPVYSSQTTNNGLMGFYKEYLFEDAITWTTDGANAGKVMYRKGKFYCTNVCGVLLNDKKYANSCFAYLLNEITPNYVSYVGNPKLMNNVMSSIQLRIPPLNVQLKISSIIELFENKVGLQIEKLERLKKQQKSMHQLLLTGIARVI